MSLWFPLPIPLIPLAQDEFRSMRLLPQTPLSLWPLLVPIISPIILPIIPLIIHPFLLVVEVRRLDLLQTLLVPTTVLITFQTIHPSLSPLPQPIPHSDQFKEDLQDLPGLLSLLVLMHLLHQIQPLILGRFFRISELSWPIRLLMLSCILELNSLLPLIPQRRVNRKAILLQNLMVTPTTNWRLSSLRMKSSLPHLLSIIGPRITKSSLLALTLRVTRRNGSPTSSFNLNTYAQFGSIHGKTSRRNSVELGVLKILKELLRLTSNVW